MRIFYRVDRGPMTDGEIVIAGRIYKNDELPDTEEDIVNNALGSHAQTRYCLIKHTHDKSCAATALPLVQPAIEAYFVAWDAAPEDPVQVQMPKKTVQVVEDGEVKARQVDDRDLAAVDLAVSAAELKSK